MDRTADAFTASVLTSSFETITVAQTAGTHGVGGWEDAGLRFRVLLNLGHSIDDPAHKSKEDCGNTGKSDRCVEKDEAGNSDGELVEHADH